MRLSTIRRVPGSRILVAAGAVALLALPPGMSAYAGSATPPPYGAPSPVAADELLAEHLRQVLDELAFQEVLDLAPPSPAGRLSTPSSTVDKDALTPSARARGYAAAAANATVAGPDAARQEGPQPISQQPQIDATVLELDEQGRIVSSGTVLMSPQYPHGVVVPVDDNLYTDAVRWREWDDLGWYTNQGQGTVDVVAGREDAPLDFMLPYPASTLKTMVAFGVLRLVDQGVVSLDDTYDYRPTSVSTLCGEANSDTVGGYLDAMVTWSANHAGCALIKLLWDHDAIDALNQEFQDLGLETLRLLGTNPANGGRWSNSITMSSLDIAKLLAIVNGGAGTLWTDPGGEPVTRDVLSDSSRQLFLTMLGEQGWNWMLSTPNFCGRDHPAPGIPHAVARRWIGPDGTATIEGATFGQDVRPCDEAAEVTFAHKPGSVGNSGADVGIVRSLPGKPYRHYIVTVLTNLGDQYPDPDRPPTPDGVVPVQHTEKLARLGRAIDQYEAARPRPAR